MSPSLALFVVGYPVAFFVIARWVPVVRERRQRWFAAHTLAILAILTGWALERRWLGVAINATWLLTSVVWYAVGGRVTDASAQSR